MIGRKNEWSRFTWFNKRKMLGSHALENCPFYDGTDAYIMRQENDHYVYHNAATVTIPTKYSATALEHASPTKKGAQEMFEPGGSILARIGRV